MKGLKDSKSLKTNKMKSENKKYQAEIILNGKEFKDCEISNIGRIVIPDKGLQGKLTLEGNVKDFDCNNNQLTSVDLSNNPKLKWADCEDNQLINLDVSKNPKLIWVDCDNNQLKDLDLSKNPKLKFVHCRNNPDLKKLIIPKNCRAKIFRDEHTKIVRVL